MPRPVLAVSLSAVNAYRECQQLYYYQYVERLRRKDRAAAPELGTILHDYLSIYYKGLQIGQKPEQSHAEAALVFEAKYGPELKRTSRYLISIGAKEQAKEIAGLTAKAARIAQRYFDTHGRQDAQDYKILLVEEFLSIPMFKGRAVSNGRLDLLTQHRKSGLVHIWEHKSTEHVPNLLQRLRDLQTALYLRKIQRMEIAPHIDSVMWNYIRTTEPTVPDLLKPKKRGGIELPPELTRRKNLDSTWQTYLASIEQHGLNPADYEEQRLRLLDREETIFFPRHDQVILSNVDVLFRDYLRSVREIAESRRAWASQEREPVRSLSLRCNYCSMAPLCTAAIIVGDESDVKASRYTVGS